MAAIELARPRDVEHVRRISKTVFEEYGQYSEILPKFFVTPGVTTLLAREGAKVVAFGMLGFLPWGKGEIERDPWIADLLAIAVVPDRQRAGIGTALMQQLLELVRDFSEWHDILEIQLTCAKTNRAGLRFFSRHGFKVVDPSHGTYSGGQLALRLARQSPKYYGEK